MLIVPSMVVERWSLVQAQPGYKLDESARQGTSNSLLRPTVFSAMPFAPLLPSTSLHRMGEQERFCLDVGALLDVGATVVPRTPVYLGAFPDPVV